jgi:hypothetical protein
MYSKESMGSPVPMSRRDFLRLSGAGFAGAVLLGAIGPGKALAQPLPNSPLMAEFVEAAEEYDVPTSLLLAMSHVNTRWEMPPPEASTYKPGDPHGRGAYGIMQLVQNDFENTLGEASELTGISEENLKTDRKSNILGGAALLAESQGEKPPRLGDYLGAVAGKGGRGKSLQAVTGVGAGKLYADQVFETLKKGSSEKTLDGEEVDLPSQEDQL